MPWCMSHKNRSTRDRSIPRSLKTWVSTKSSISQLTFFNFTTQYEYTQPVQDCSATTGVYVYVGLLNIRPCCRIGACRPLGRLDPETWPASPTCFRLRFPCSIPSRASRTRDNMRCWYCANCSFSWAYLVKIRRCMPYYHRNTRMYIRIRLEKSFLYSSMCVLLLCMYIYIYL